MKNKVKLCECGCGQPTPIATTTRRGFLKGQPQRCLRGHHTGHKTLEERFWSKVDKQGPMPSLEAVHIHPEISGQCCWVFSWSGISRPHLTGLDKGKTKSAYHVAWFLRTGSWPTFLLHKCDNGNCVRFSHLMIGNPQTNVDDMIAKGRARCATGDEHGKAKLTWEQVRSIRSELATYKSGMISALARKYKVTPWTIGSIRCNRRWKEEEAA